MINANSQNKNFSVQIQEEIYEKLFLPFRELAKIIGDDKIHFYQNTKRKIMRVIVNLDPKEYQFIVKFSTQTSKAIVPSQVKKLKTSIEKAIPELNSVDHTIFFISDRITTNAKKTFKNEKGIIAIDMRYTNILIAWKYILNYFSHRLYKYISKLKQSNSGGKRGYESEVLTILIQMIVTSLKPLGRLGDINLVMYAEQKLIIEGDTDTLESLLSRFIETLR